MTIFVSFQISKVPTTTTTKMKKIWRNESPFLRLTWEWRLASSWERNEGGSDSEADKKDSIRLCR